MRHLAAGTNRAMIHHITFPTNGQKREQRVDGAASSALEIIIVFKRSLLMEAATMTFKPTGGNRTRSGRSADG
jgi:hypothetical protein